MLDVISFSLTCKSLESVCKTLRATILKSGRAILVTYQPDQDGWGIEDDLKIGKFGLHDVSNALSFCFTTNTSLDLELLNQITKTKVTLPSFGNNLSGIELPSYRELSVIFPPFARDVWCIVLSRTPSHKDGYEAIALFSDGLLTYTTQGEHVWRVLKNPTDHDDNAYNHYPEVFFDIIVYHGWVIVVEEDGDIFAWDMRGSGIDGISVISPLPSP
uniref:KIB1-4 beta-propeller domain-containing protein n=1 Tax=Setaria italica TaxID=4555 RepID=K3YD11_SETIT